MNFSLSFKSRTIRWVFLLFYLFTGHLIAQDHGFKYRYLWVVRNTLTSPQKIDHMLDTAERSGITDILVQVRGRGDAYYQSLLVPKSPMLNGQSFDPLAYTIDKAHERGIRVHAWVNVYLAWSPDQATAPQGHLIYTHKDWFDQDFNGDDIPENGHELLGEPDEGYYLSPEHPKVNAHLLSVFRELVAKYPIDGMHLDYIRYKGAAYGYNPAAVKVFQLQSGKNPKKVVLSFRKMSDNPVLISEKDKWDDFRRKSITELVKETHEMIQEVRPECILSAAVKPDLVQARENFYQEWDVWLAAGYLDQAIPMNYTAELHEFARVIDLIYDNLPQKYRNRIVMGIALYNQQSFDVADKIFYTHVTRFPGICMFSYNTLYAQPDFIRSLNLDRYK